MYEWKEEMRTEKKRVALQGTSRTCGGEGRDMGKWRYRGAKGGIMHKVVSSEMDGAI